MHGRGKKQQALARKRFTLAALCMLCLSACSQQIQLGDSSSAVIRKQHVVLLSDALTTTAGAPQVVELTFRVDPGFHINSHTPKDELLIATSFAADDASGVKVQRVDYPPGSVFRIGSGSASETLDVYQGEFRLRLHLVAPRGDSTLSGSLRYQACDNAACFPPRTLPVRVAVTAK